MKFVYLQPLQPSSMILESNFPDIQQFILNCMFLGCTSFVFTIDKIEIPIIVILPPLTYLFNLPVYLGFLQIQYLMNTIFDNI